MAIVTTSRGYQKSDGTFTGPMGDALNDNIDLLDSELNTVDADVLLRMLKSANLSDLADLVAARSNLGGGSPVQTLAEINALIAAANALKLSLTGGTMTGKITLDGPPTVDLHAATKKYVDDNAGGGGGGVSAKHAIGRFYGALAAVSSGMTATANRHVAYPVKLDTTRTYDRLATIVHANGSGELHVGLYSDTDGNPDARLAASSDLGATSGLKLATISHQPSSPDAWLSIRATTALSIRRAISLFRDFLQVGTTDTTDLVYKIAVFKSGVGAGALPDPFGTIDGFITSTLDSPLVGIRAG